MRRNHNPKELDQLQKFKKENQRLKKELAHLRKQISRLDLESLEAAKQMVFDQEEKDRLNETIGDPNIDIENLKKIWKCNSCQNGWLEINTYPKMGETWYYRRCSDPTCKKRTLGKRFDESVKGIVKK
jgi:hypothetical protein